MYLHNDLLSFKFLKNTRKGNKTHLHTLCAHIILKLERHLLDNK